MVLDAVLPDGLKEAGPPAPGVELGFRSKQLLAAAGAAIDARSLGVSVLAGKSPLRALLAHDVILLRRQLLPPFAFRFADFFSHVQLDCPVMKLDARLTLGRRQAFALSCTIRRSQAEILLHGEQYE